MHNDHRSSSTEGSNETSPLNAELAPAEPANAELDRLSAERDRLAAELVDARRQISTLTESAGAGSQREQLARVIQDTMSQELTSLVLAVKRGRRELRTGNAKGAAKQFNVLEENLRRALTDTRTLVATGTPVAPAGSGGLTSALVALGDSAEQDSAAHGGALSVTVRTQGTPSLSRSAEEILLACATEAIANVRAHSGATAASVTVNATYDSAVLRVADNGCGFDADASPTVTFTSQGDDPGSRPGGISTVRAALEKVGGTLLIVSTVGNGTSVTATLPAGS